MTLRIDVYIHLELAFNVLHRMVSGGLHLQGVLLLGLHIFSSHHSNCLQGPFPPARDLFRHTRHLLGIQLTIYYKY